MILTPENNGDVVVQVILVKLFAGALWKIIDDKYSIKINICLKSFKLGSKPSLGALKRTMIFIICYSESMITRATPRPPVMVLV